MQSQILVPLDGSALAATVLPHAAVLAHTTGSSIILLRVMPPPSLNDPLAAFLATGDGGEPSSTAARAALNTAVDDLEAQGLAVQTEVLEGEPAQVITTYAATHPAVQIIAMTTHGASGRQRWLLGSITEAVVHTAPCALLLVRPIERGEGAAAPPAHPYRTILVPLDGSALAERALVQTFALAQRPSALAQRPSALVLLLAVVPHADPLCTSTQPAEQDASEQLTGYLECLARRWQAAGVAVEIAVTHGHPAEVILQLSEAREVDLLVLTTHGGRGLAHPGMGRVALKVAQAARCPVLLVRSTAPETEDLGLGEAADSIAPQRNSVI